MAKVDSLFDISKDSKKSAKCLALKKSSTPKIATFYVKYIVVKQLAYILFAKSNTPEWG